MYVHSTALLPALLLRDPCHDDSDVERPPSLALSEFWCVL